MCKKYYKVLIFAAIICAVIARPIDYNQNRYAVGDQRYFTSHYNRLPQNIQVDEIQEDIDDYDDSQTERPLQNNQYQSGSYPLLNENKRKRKKRKRLCIPIQSIGSPLFSNRVKRNYMEKDEQGKTLGLLLGGGGYPYYGGYNPYNGIYPNYAGGFPHLSSPQRPIQQSPIAQFGTPLYDAYGGYPCIPVSTGHIPNQGPFGFLGSSGGGGGLFDFGSNPSVNYPQTVIINRPPLFGNRPNFGANRPQGVSDSNGTRPGFFGSVVDKLQEFVN